MIDQPLNEELHHTNIEFATHASEGAPSQSEREELDDISFQQYFKVKMKHVKKKMKEVRKEIKENFHEFQQDMKDRSKKIRDRFKRTQNSHDVIRSMPCEFKEKSVISSEESRHPKFCPQCGNSVSLNGQFCPLCGFRY